MTNEQSNKETNRNNHHSQEDSQHNSSRLASFSRPWLLASAVIFLLLASLGGYYVWNEYINYTEMDLGSNMTLSFKGKSGSAGIDKFHNLVEYDRSDEKLVAFEESIVYHYSKRYNLENGDKVTVTALYDKNKAKELKLKITNSSKEFEVTGLIHRFENPEDVPNHLISSIKEAGESQLKSKNRNDDYDSYSFSYYGTFFAQYEKSDSIIVVFQDDHLQQSSYSGQTTASTRYYYYKVAGIDTASKEELAFGLSTTMDAFMDEAYHYIEDESQLLSFLSKLTEQGHAPKITRLE